MKEENLERFTSDVAEIIADKLIEKGITKDSRKVIMNFPLPEDAWESELALRSLDMALALNDLSMQKSYHKHTDDEKEYAFWERFSEEVNRVIKDRNIFELVISRMI